MTLRATEQRNAEIERRYVERDPHGFETAEIGRVRPAPMRLLPDNVDLARAALREGERLAGVMDAQVEEIAKILGWCLRCETERRSCLCRAGGR